MRSKLDVGMVLQLVCVAVIAAAFVELGGCQWAVPLDDCANRIAWATGFCGAELQ